VCLVTGASRGIGAAIAARLARGHRIVFLNHRASEEGASEVQRAARDRGECIESVRADVADEGEVRRMIDRVAERCATLDVLVHNAAAPVALKPLFDLDWTDDVLPQLATSCRGFLNLVQAARPLFVSGTRIVVLLSDAIFHTPPARMGAYLTAKAALWGLTRAAAKELQPLGVRVYMVAPSLARTDLVLDLPERAREIVAAQHPTGRLVDPEDVAAVVEMLIADAGKYMHGANVVVNGGLAF
jgi:3-oxoacyl-[acyl-carrier protein] reductase